eukprot:12832128-Ditylum_brightwellii.AAC.1
MRELVIFNYNHNNQLTWLSDVLPEQEMPLLQQQKCQNRNHQISNNRQNPNVDPALKQVEGGAGGRVVRVARVVKTKQSIKQQKSTAGWAAQKKKAAATYQDSRHFRKRFFF